MNKSFVREILLMICGACALQINIPRIRLTPIDLVVGRLPGLPGLTGITVQCDRIAKCVPGVARNKSLLCNQKQPKARLLR